MNITRYAILEIVFYCIFAAIFTYVFNGDELQTLIHSDHYKNEAFSILWNSFFFTFVILLMLGISRYILGILLPILLCICVTAHYIEHSQNVTINANFLGSLLESNMGGWQHIFAAPALLAQLAAAVFVGLLITYLGKKLLSQPLGYLAHICRAVIIITVGFSVYTFSNTNHPFLVYPLKLVEPTTDFFTKRKEVFQLREQKQKATTTPLTSSAQKDLTIVLIIGENTNPDYMQINGYTLNTTPRLNETNKLMNYGFMKACEDGKHSSIPCILTKSSIRKKVSPEKSLISIFKNQGFKTFWISQYPVFGDNSLGITAIAKEAEFRYFRNDIDASFAGTHDNIILPTIKHAINQSGNKLIIAHMRGNAWPYHKRYPKEFHHFTPLCLTSDKSQCSAKEILNSYANAIGFTDHTLAELTDELRDQNGLLFFTSNHGELIDTTLPIKDRLLQKKHVPFLVWPSPKFVEQNTDQFNFLNANQNQSLNHQNIYHSLLDCAGFKGNIIKTRKSVCNKMPAPIRKYFESAIWLDNSEKPLQPADDYSGVHLPVEIIRHNGLFVENQSPKLRLQEQLIRHDYAGNYWLRLSNLNNDTVSEFINQMKLISARINIMPRLFIESDDYESLHLIKRKFPEIHIIANIDRFQRYDSAKRQHTVDLLRRYKFEQLAISKHNITRYIVDKFISYPLYSGYANDGKQLNIFKQFGINVVLTHDRETLKPKDHNDVTNDLTDFGFE